MCNFEKSSVGKRTVHSQGRDTSLHAVTKTKWWRRSSRVSVGGDAPQPCRTLVLMLRVMSKCKT